MTLPEIRPFQFKLLRKLFTMYPMDYSSIVTYMNPLITNVSSQDDLFHQIISRGSVAFNMFVDVLETITCKTVESACLTLIRNNNTRNFFKFMWLDGDNSVIYTSNSWHSSKFLCQQDAMIYQPQPMYGYVSKRCLLVYDSLYIPALSHNNCISQCSNSKCNCQ